MWSCLIIFALALLCFDLIVFSYRSRTVSRLSNTVTHIIQAGPLLASQRSKVQKTRLPILSPADVRYLLGGRTGGDINEERGAEERYEGLIGVGGGGSGVRDGNGTDGGEIHGGSLDQVWGDCTDDHFRDIVGFLSKTDGMDLDHVSVHFYGMRGGQLEGIVVKQDMLLQC